MTPIARLSRSRVAARLASTTACLAALALPGLAQEATVLNPVVLTGAAAATGPVGD